jgi:hypothetical protein
MPDRTPSAAQAMYGHLPSGTPDIVQRQRPPSPVADAVYSHLRPTLQPQPNRRQNTEEVSLAQRCDENPWLEHGLAMMGLRRVR